MPYLLGTFFQLIFVGPLRLENNQVFLISTELIYFLKTGLTFIWQDWAMGVLHLKIILAIVMMGPEWWLRTACDRV